MLYTTEGNLQSSTDHPDFGYICIYDPSGTPVITVDSINPTTAQERTTVTAYDDKLFALPTTITKPISSHLTQHLYYGINDTTASTAAGYFPANLSKTTTPNSVVTDFHYDKLGRLQYVLKPGDTLTPLSPSVAYGYSDDDYEPAYPTMNSVWTKRDDNAILGSDGGTWSREFLDGFGRVIQTQEPFHDWAGNPYGSPPVTPTGRESVADKTYDSDGQIEKESNLYAIFAYTNTPTGTCGGSGQPICNPYHTPSTSAPYTEHTYDLLGRPLVSRLPYIAGYTTQQRETVHHYGVTSVAPYLWIDDVIDQNRHRKQTRTDVFGRTKSIYEISGHCTGSGVWGGQYSCTGGYSEDWAIDASTDYTYDELDRLREVFDDEDISGLAMNPNLTTNPIVVEYDQLGRKTKQIDPDMGEWTYDYDAVGNLVEQVDARDVKTCFFYDKHDRITEKRYRTANDPCGAGLGTLGPQYYYDSGTTGRGQRYYIRLPDWSYTYWTYDSRGRVKREVQRVTGPVGGHWYTYYEYNHDDSVRSIQRPESNGLHLEETDYTYNPAGIDSLKGNVTVGGYFGNTDYVADTLYTLSGQLERRTLGNTGQQVHFRYQYDTWYRPTWHWSGTSYNGVDLQQIARVYDPASNIKSIYDYRAGSPQIQSFTYDHRNRLDSAVATGGTSGNGDFALEDYEYDPVGNLTDSGDIEYRRYPDIPGGVGPEKPHATWRRVGSGSTTASQPSLEARISPTCVYGTWVDVFVNGAYTGVNHYISPGGANTTMHTLAFGNINLTGNDVVNFTFTSLDFDLNTPNCWVRVDKITVAGMQMEAEGGKIIADNGWHTSDGKDVAPPVELLDNNNPPGGGAPSNETVLEVSEKSGLRLVKGSKAGAYEHDENGNITWKVIDGNAFNLVWDEENRLSKVLQWTDTATEIAKYTYDGDDKRIKASRQSISAPYIDTTVTIGDLYEQVIWENSGGGSPFFLRTESKYHVGGEVVAFREGNATPPVTLLWSHPDQVASTHKTVSAGTPPALFSENRYMPFGEDRYSTAAQSRTKRLYTGQHLEDGIQGYEDELGLYYYNARYYDPQLSRFISPDDLVPDPSDPQDLNRYSYAKNNPIRYNDPSGHCPVCLSIAVGTVTDVALDFVIAKYTGEDFSVGKSLATNGALNTATLGFGGKIAKIKHARSIMKAYDKAQTGMAAAATVQTSMIALEDGDLSVEELGSIVYSGVGVSGAVPKKHSTSLGIRDGHTTKAHQKSAQEQSRLRGAHSCLRYS